MLIFRQLSASCSPTLIQQGGWGGRRPSHAVPGALGAGSPSPQGLQSQLLPRHLPLHGPHPLMYPRPHPVSVADAFRTDLRIFPFFASFCYSVYFSVIVLKLGLKLLRVIRHQISYNSVRKYFFFGFGIYQVLLLAALGYSIAKKEEDCFGTILSIQLCLSWWQTASAWQGLSSS